MKRNRILKSVLFIEDCAFVGVVSAMVGSFVNDDFIVVHRRDASDLFFQYFFYVICDEQVLT
jgi:3-phosphoglycerate kinase